jgi:RNA-binding protein YlmH
MSVVTPERSLQQRLDALERANMIRQSRKALKHEVRSGAVNVLDIVEDPPSYALTMRLEDLLMAVPGTGCVKVKRLFKRTQISPSKTLGGLTYRQRDLVAEYLIWARA